MSVTISEKKMTAIVGLSGSGKTTLSDLIARFGMWRQQNGPVVMTLSRLSRLDITP